MGPTPGIKIHGLDRERFDNGFQGQSGPEGWFIVDPKDYTKFDMAHQLLRTEIDSSLWCKKIWRIHLHPLFLLKSFFTLRRWRDIKMAFRGLISLFGHLRDY